MSVHVLRHHLTSSPPQIHPQCYVSAATSGTTCQAYCDSKGRVCMHAQDNANPDGANDNKCTIYDGHDRQDTSANGCNQVGGSARIDALYNNRAIRIYVSHALRHHLTSSPP